MSVDKFIDSFRSDGEHDSSGQFTIGWNTALEKLQTYKAVDPTSYLLFLVSAGCAYGARNITISEGPTKTTLTMHECYVAEHELRAGFQLVAEGSFQHEAFDLISGLKGALQHGFHSVELASVHPTKKSYSWALKTGSEEQSTPLETEEKVCTSISLIRSVPKPAMLSSFWEKLLGHDPGPLGGFVGMSEPARLVDKRCDFSDVPITINTSLANRPFYFALSPIAVKVGEVDGVRFRAHQILNTDRPDWKGALAFQNGPLKAVVNGLTYDLGEHSEVTGIVWTNLNRDLSRVRVIKDESYHAFLDEIREITTLMQRAEDKMMGEL